MFCVVVPSRSSVMAGALADWLAGYGQRVIKRPEIR